MKSLRGRKTILIRPFLFLYYIPLVLLAKAIRYTVLKKSLVDVSIGHTMLPYVISEALSYSPVIDGDATVLPIYFFRYVNIFHLHSYFAFEVAITIIYNLIVIWMLCRCNERYDVRQFLFLLCSILQLNIFAFNLSKEPVQMIYFLMLFLVVSGRASSRAKVALVVIIILLSAMTFRRYYILLLYFMSAFLALERITHISGKKRWIVIFAGMVFSYAAVLIVSSFLFPQDYAELVRVRLRDASAMYRASVGIAPFFQSPKPSSYLLNYVSAFARMLFPFELIRLGMKYALYTVTQLVISAVYIHAFRSYQDAPFEKKLATAIMIGFLFMSVAFEPDFGSWVRHEAVTLPVILVMSGIFPS